MVFSLLHKLFWSYFDKFLLGQVPHVNRVDYQLIDISEDGFVSLFTFPMFVRVNSVLCLITRLGWDKMENLNYNLLHASLL